MMILVRWFAVGVIGRGIPAVYPQGEKADSIAITKGCICPAFRNPKGPRAPPRCLGQATPRTPMDKISFYMTLLGTGCWAVCFWWMNKISKEQNKLLDKLSDQGKRIEKLSKIEHDL